MMNQHDFEDYLDWCEALAQRLYDEGKWPFDEPPTDSTNPPDLVDSGSNPITYD